MRISIVLIIILLTSCGAKKPKVVEVQKSDSVQINLPNYQGNDLNQTARIIAGISNPNDTLYARAIKNAAWQNYAKESDSVWSNYPIKNADLYRWVTQQVNPLTKDYKTIFYPFSGPDFLYVNMIYPNAETIYMFGMERVGSVPDFGKIRDARLGEVLNQYKISINEVLSDSYYRTMKMSAYLHNENMDGVTPVIMLFMVRCGKQIADIRLVTIDPQGALIGADASNFRSLKNQGVEFTYYNSTDTIERKLIYLKGNVEDKFLDSNSAYKKFFTTLRPEATFTKSAAYLMHWSVFSTIRNVILERSKIVVQDDTGVAFRYFKPSEWDFKLFGSYTGCIPEFKNQFEPDLKKAYDSTKNIENLKFRFGYSEPSNARIAIRK